jgi:hypothetical protein
MPGPVLLAVELPLLYFFIFFNAIKEAKGRFSIPKVVPDIPVGDN